MNQNRTEQSSTDEDSVCMLHDLLCSAGLAVMVLLLLVLTEIQQKNADV